jgi:hypothetical protein
MIENLKLDSFSEYLKTKFRVHVGDDTTVELELVEAKDGGSNAKQERFSILFRGPLDVTLGQGTYRVEHDKLGALDLFVVPVGRSESGIEYEAIFNRLIR